MPQHYQTATALSLAKSQTLSFKTREKSLTCSLRYLAYAWMLAACRLGHGCRIYPLHCCIAV